MLPKRVLIIKLDPLGTGLCLGEYRRRNWKSAQGSVGNKRRRRPRSSGG